MAIRPPIERKNMMLAQQLQQPEGFFDPSFFMQNLRSIGSTGEVARRPGEEVLQKDEETGEFLLPEQVEENKRKVKLDAAGIGRNLATLFTGRR